MKTEEQLRSRFNIVTVDGTTFRVKHKCLWWWQFVERFASLSSVLIDVSTPCEFASAEEAQEAIDRWAHADYIAQPAAWR